MNVEQLIERLSEIPGYYPVAVRVADPYAERHLERVDLAAVGAYAVLVPENLPPAEGWTWEF